MHSLHSSEQVFNPRTFFEIGSRPERTHVVQRERFPELFRVGEIERRQRPNVVDVYLAFRKGLPRHALSELALNVSFELLGRVAKLPHDNGGWPLALCCVS